MSLQLKRLRDARQLAVASYDIYRAVLQGGARDAAGVRDWLRRESEM